VTTTISGTQLIWSRIEPVHRAILAHPFLTGLTDGSLPKDAFRRYIVQDALYLREYARSLAMCAARAWDTDTIRMFASHASVAIEVEQALHTSLAKQLGIDPAGILDTPMTPTCRAYTDYTKQACALGERAVAIASVLPCYWIYWEIGKELIAQGSPVPAYQTWIDTYADEHFAESVRGALAACDVVAEGLSPDAAEAMVQSALRAAHYEWMFWDSAHRDERWPLEGVA